MAKRKLQWAADTWEEYLEWQTQNKAMTKRINQLTKDMLRHPF